MKASPALQEWWAKRVFHPFAFALLPVASIAASNISEISLRNSLRSVPVLLLVAVLLLIGLRSLTRDWDRAGFLSSILLLLFFSYGHVYYGLVSDATSGLFTNLGLVGSHQGLLVASALLLLLSVLVSLRLRDQRKTLTTLFNLAAMAGLLVPALQIGLYELQVARPFTFLSADLPLQAPDQIPAEDNLPDLYYIVLDGYGRQDVLLDLYLYDNTPFLEELERMGFNVLDETRSNYVQTGLSLASSLNLTGLETLTDQLDPASDNRLPLARMIRTNALRGFLEDMGYTTIGLASGYRMTEWEDADRFLRPFQRAINPLEGLLFETSAAIVLQDWAASRDIPAFYPGYSSHRELVNFTLQQLPMISTWEGPKFIFAHIVSPHPPFVFGPNGQVVDHHFRYSFRDGDAFLGTREEYQAGYLDQLRYINDQILQVVRQILETPGTQPIIILQGDHGPGLGLDYQSIEKTDTRERVGILNAIFLGDRDESQLYEAMTPVNTFRVVLNSLFHSGLKLLPDRSYYSAWETPFQFIDVPPE